MKPIFVRINEYKELLDILDVVRAKLTSAKETLASIYEMKSREDKELAAWTANLDEISKKVDEVHKTLFEGTP